MTTVTATLLSVMALLVSLQALREYSLQTQIESAQAKPVLLIRVDELYDSDSKVFPEHRLVIENMGAAVREFRHTVRSYLVLELSGLEEREYVIPVAGFFSAFPTGNVKGKLAISIGYQNNLHIMKIDREVRDAAHAKGEFASIRTVHIAELRYIDLLGEKQHEFFRIDGAGAGFSIQSVEADEWIRKFRSPDAVVMQFSEISGQDLMWWADQQATPETR